MSTTHEELTRLSDVIGLIYEGATDPSRWTRDITPAVAEYIQAPRCVLFTPLHPPQNGGFCFLHGISQESMELRMTVFRDEDIWTNVGQEKGIFWEGNVALGTDLVSHEQLVESRWYKEFLTRDPHMMQLMTSVVFGMDATHSMPVVCSVFRGFDAPVFGDADINRLRLILPHISRSLGVMQRIRSAELTMATSLAALDRLPTGVLLTDSAGEVTFANRAAQRMLNNSDGLKLKKLTRTSGLGSLCADNELANRALAAALRSTLSRDPYATEHFSDCVVVPRSSGNTAYTLQFSALGSQTEFGADSAASAIVFLADGAQQVEVDPALLQSAYSLTAAETRVALALLECCSANEVADYLNVSPNTVRTQMKHIYAKLGVDTRARFVKLMMGLAKNRH